VTWPERAAAACAPLGVRANAAQHNKITMGTRKTSRKFIYRTNIVAQTTHPASKLNRCFKTFRRKEFHYEGKIGAVQPIFFSQEIFARRSKIKFRILLVGFLQRF
jgi:hypothetical protein